MYTYLYTHIHMHILIHTFVHIFHRAPFSILRYSHSNKSIHSYIHVYIHTYSQRRSEFKSLDLKIRRSFRRSFAVTETPCTHVKTCLKLWHSRENVFDMYGDSCENLLVNFGSHNYFKSDLLCLRIHIICIRGFYNYSYVHTKIP